VVGRRWLRTAWLRTAWLRSEWLGRRSLGAARGGARPQPGGLTALIVAASLFAAAGPAGAESPDGEEKTAAGSGASAQADALPDLDAEQIAAKVQDFYDGAKTFQATFNQRYTIYAYNKKKEDRGRVSFVKPGKMSWRYESNGNRVVSDGRLLKIYEADNKQLYEQNVTKSAYPAALSFLLGEGKLSASFAMKKLSSQTLRFKGGYVLLAIPREPTPAYQKMLLYVDGKTFQVRRVLLIDAQKNKNVFDFSKPLVNLDVPASEFRFTPPPGTQVIKP
jgi:outer membrane lipoprotein carrier protein